MGNGELTSTTWAASISLGTDSEGAGLEASVLGVEVEKLSVAELEDTPAVSPAMEPDILLAVGGFCGGRFLQLVCRRVEVTIKGFMQVKNNNLRVCMRRDEYK